MQNLDRPLFFTFAGLLLFGLGSLYSASSTEAVKLTGDPYHFVVHQLLWAVIGIGVAALVVRVDVHRWEAAALPLFFLCLILLVLVLIPGVGVEVNAAQRWLQVGSFRFQPAEAAKVAMVLLLARTLSRDPARLERFGGGLAPQLGLTAVMVVLVLMERDLGNAVVIALVTLVMLFLGGARLRHLGAIVLACCPLGVLAIAAEPYRIRRVFTYLHPWDDPAGGGWQITQSLMAIGSGGLFGTGVGAGVQKRVFLPAPHTDFIFSVVGEEVGLMGTLLLVSLFLLLVWRGVHIALRAPTPFAQLLAAGTTTMITVQALLNMMVCTGMVPTKGLTLPFFSAGGSALVVDLVAAGFLLATSRWVAE
ncbi:MAG: putative lipid II flippase FtsW [Nitrospirae bacterium CG18_big_fil_WC_8_21_14_2_50_70_55]|nr:putative lipid II flippase FtsW [Deltaproteobacteria bacterium]OIP65813.1 MAG: putative lipid II flippase FtsW [Nitrospirae bacterium CG2_30_70_394]PIQ04059.1 MAG: putative lipid II flippase FtsW [Nitrospirae bacterium CG18_big_fil_WC_8_21_14_2_50_70_55]PIU77226.1 MAG: putative lipid II flippase FtsW [Nitrospirae bacterium CG06_land_8_20_14_3_00_70_43]PIW82984.1 MAG: putative lipid II flippase FtsW [Nitrospirae bacterium CG_4_8_14_3_um_filter_70_85]PIX82481.1 MAG: putative lipid II flippase